MTAVFVKVTTVAGFAFTVPMAPADAARLIAAWQSKPDARAVFAAPNGQVEFRHRDLAKITLTR